MTEYTTLTSSPAPSDASVIADLADEACARELLTVVEGRVVAVIRRADQVVELIDTEMYDDTPARKEGSVTLTDAAGFVTYVNRHSLERATTLWADEKTGSITAVLDDHASHLDQDAEGSPGWAQHRAVLQLRETEDWKHWVGKDGQFMRQDAFAEHIEDGVDAIREPEAATMLEVAQTFHAKTGASFASSKRLSGEIQFGYEEQTSAKAGERGTIEIPETFLLGLQPFEGSDAYGLNARFRFRLANGSLSLGYRMIRPDKVRSAAFREIVDQVAGGAGLPVMAGTPRS